MAGLDCARRYHAVEIRIDELARERSIQEGWAHVASGHGDRVHAGQAVGA